MHMETLDNREPHAPAVDRHMATRIRQSCEFFAVASLNPTNFGVPACTTTSRS
jgi:hypothetical protein